VPLVVDLNLAINQVECNINRLCIYKILNKYNYVF
jgi:hypothetical protein